MIYARSRCLFEARFDILLYDLTSTYFECDPPEHGKRKFGYSRDKRSDWVEVVIALIVTPAGFPLAYEVLPGNTLETQTLADFLGYCLQATLKARLRSLATGLTPRSALEKFAAIQMVDVQLPTTDGRTLILSGYTEPQQDQQLLLDRLRLVLPAQPPPRIAATPQALTA